jgi:hypothetical protein
VSSPVSRDPIEAVDLPYQCCLSRLHSHSSAAFTEAFQETHLSNNAPPPLPSSFHSNWRSNAHRVVAGPCKQRRTAGSKNMLSHPPMCHAECHAFRQLLPMCQACSDPKLVLQGRREAANAGLVRQGSAPQFLVSHIDRDHRRMLSSRYQFNSTAPLSERSMRFCNVCSR